MTPPNVMHSLRRTAPDKQLAMFLRPFVSVNVIGLSGNLAIFALVQVSA